MTTIAPSARSARATLSAVAEVDRFDDRELLDVHARVVWNHLTEPGDSVAGRLIAALGPRAALETMLGGSPSAAGIMARELAEGLKRWRPRCDPEAIGAALTVAARHRVRAVTPHDPAWPVQLGDLGAHAPLCLWVRGDVTALVRLQPSVALVGARAATSYGDHVAVELAADLATSRMPIVSGAAYGIDGAAHRATLAVGGLTIALLAGGVDRAYPAGHADLLTRIAATGAVVSETPCGSAPTKWRFLQRNRLIASLAQAVVVVEAGWRSGSLNTAGHAVALGRALGAVPGPVTSAASAGCHRLLREFGAECVTSAADVRGLLSLENAADSVAIDDADADPFPTGGRPRTDDRTRVRDAMSARAWRSVDDIARRSGMSIDDAEGMLGLLRLEGAAVADGARWRLRVDVGG